MDIQDKSNIFSVLNDLGCCLRCTIRFLNIDSDLLDYNQMENPISILDEDTNETNNETASKKSKTNICIVCLNILQTSNLDNIVREIMYSEAKEYDSDDFNIFVSFPKTIHIRSHSVYIFLKHQFPNYYEGRNVCPFNKVFRFTIKDMLAKALNKKFNRQSNLEISVSIDYEDDEKEVKNFAKINQKTSRTDSVSRNDIFDTLPNVDDSIFKNHFQVPPAVPSSEAVYSGTICNAAPLYIGGRYLKYSRKIGQTPWIINGQKITEHCVQDFIFDAIRKVLGIKNNMIFSSSGREDADVRMLGNGRPFYIQIDNPKSRKITKEQFYVIQDAINSSKMVAVHSLQIVSKEQLRIIKEGEENKRKWYKALCIIKNGNVKECVETINKLGEMKIAQKTPVRVLHRRTLMIRDKMIHRMAAKEVSENMFELDLETQAGTYVKEFVHGDLDRTQPNIGRIINCEVDIIALDVMNIDLKWP